MPPVEFTTKGCWVEIPTATKQRIDADEERDFYGGLHGAVHAIKNVVPLYVLCDPGDIDCEHVALPQVRERYGEKKKEGGGWWRSRLIKRHIWQAFKISGV